MKSGRLPKCLVMFAMVAAICCRDHIVEGVTWTADTGTNADWNDNGNWTASFPNAPAAVADLTNDITADQPIDLNIGITVGVLTMGDANSSHNFQVLAGTAGSLTMNNSGSAVEINVPRGTNSLGNPSGTADNFTLSLPAGENLEIDVATGAQLNLFSHTTATPGSVSGGVDIIKRGAGNVNLGRLTTYNYTGDLIIEEGTATNGRLPAGNNLIIHGGASYQQTDFALRFSSIRGDGVYLPRPPNDVTIIGTGSPDTSVQKVILTTDGEIHPGDDTANQVGSLLIGQVGGGNAFRMETGGELFIDLESLSQFDQLLIRRAQTLVTGGTVHLNFKGGYIPDEGDEFEIIQALTTSAGGFIDANSTLFDEITHNLSEGIFVASLTDPLVSGPNIGDFGSITLTFVIPPPVIPEPSTFLLMALGTCFLMGGTRRRAGDLTRVKLS